MLMPKLVRIPEKVHTIDEMFGVVRQLENVENVIMLVNDDEGVWTMAIAGITAERMNWMLDRAKLLLHKAD